MSLKRLADLNNEKKDEVVMITSHDAENGIIQLSVFQNETRYKAFLLDKKNRWLQPVRERVIVPDLNAQIDNAAISSTGRKLGEKTREFLQTIVIKDPRFTTDFFKAIVITV